MNEITQVATSLLGTSIPCDSSLMSAGLDSLGVTEFARDLGDRLGIVLPSTLLFDHPSVTTISCSLAPSVSCNLDASLVGEAENELNVD